MMICSIKYLTFAFLLFFASDLIVMSDETDPGHFSSSQSSDVGNTSVNANYCYPEIDNSLVLSIVDEVSNGIQLDTTLTSSPPEDGLGVETAGRIIDLVENAEFPNKLKLAQAVLAEIKRRAHSEDFNQIKEDYDLSAADEELNNLLAQYSDHSEDLKMMFRLLHEPSQPVSVGTGRGYNVPVNSIPAWRGEYKSALRSKGINNFGLEGVDQIVDQILQVNGELINHIRGTELSISTQENIIQRLRSMTSSALEMRSFQVDADHSRYMQNLGALQLMIDVGTTLLPGGILAKVLGKGVAAAHGVRGTNSLRSIAQAGRNAGRSRSSILAAQARHTGKRVLAGTSTWAGGGFVFGSGMHVLSNLIDSIDNPYGFFCEYARLSIENGSAAETAFLSASDAAWKGAIASLNPLTLLGVVGYDIGATVHSVTAQINNVQELLRAAENFERHNNFDAADLYYDRAYRESLKIGIEPLAELLPFLSRQVRRSARENFMQNIRFAQHVFDSFKKNRLANRNPSQAVDLDSAAASATQTIESSISARASKISPSEANSLLREAVNMFQRAQVLFLRADPEKLDIDMARGHFEAALRNIRLIDNGYLNTMLPPRNRGSNDYANLAKLAEEAHSNFQRINQLIERQTVEGIEGAVAYEQMSSAYDAEVALATGTTQ